MAARKKDGAPDWKYYESLDTIALFEPVKQYLLKNCKKVSSHFICSRFKLKIHRAIMYYNRCQINQIRDEHMAQLNSSLSRQCSHWISRNRVIFSSMCKWNHLRIKLSLHLQHSCYNFKKYVCLLRQVTKVHCTSLTFYIG